MKGKIFWIIILVIAAGAVAWLIKPQRSIAPGGGEAAFCTMDAMQCPDGSWVGRTGPNCEFVCPSE